MSKAAHPKKQPLATTREVAEYLRLSTDSVLEAVHDGRIPAYRIGGTGHPLFRWDDIERALKPADRPRAAKAKAKAKAAKPGSAKTKRGSK